MEDNKRESDFQEGLNQYYILKEHYYKGLHKKQRKIRNDPTLSNSKKKELLDSLKHKCVNCKREVGASFSETNRTFKLVCGDSVNPCNLHIELIVGKKHHIDDIISITNELIDEIKERIIKLKMDLTYNYKTEEEVVEEFNSQKRSYIELQKKIDTLISIKAKKLDIANRKEALANNEKSLQDMISIIKKLIEEYESNNEPQKITEIVNIYNENLREILVNIRTNKYLINRVNIECKKEPGNIITYGKLIQKEVDSDAMYVYYDDDEKSERKVYKN
jgi:hypothetical protein